MLVPGTGRGAGLSIPVPALQSEPGATGCSPKPWRSRGDGNRELMGDLAGGMRGWRCRPARAVLAPAGRIQRRARIRSPLCHGWCKGPGELGGCRGLGC